jgi:hypothetical protein
MSGGGGRKKKEEENTAPSVSTGTGAPYEVGVPGQATRWPGLGGGKSGLGAAPPTFPQFNFTGTPPGLIMQQLMQGFGQGSGMGALASAFTPTSQIGGKRKDLSAIVAAANEGYEEDKEDRDDK